MKKMLLIVWAGISLGLVGVVVAIVLAHPAQEAPPAAAAAPPYARKSGEQQLAYLLVKLVLRARATIFQDYTRHQSPLPGVDIVYQRWLAKNQVLPAAVADRVFAEVVPGATAGRAWVKMIVQKPRNPHNAGDAIARELFREIRDGAPSAERVAGAAYYYGEPIKSTSACLPCHGEPKGSRDPVFPQFRKEGWKAGEVIGAVVARVEPEK